MSSRDEAEVSGALSWWQSCEEAGAVWLKQPRATQPNNGRPTGLQE